MSNVLPLFPEHKSAPRQADSIEAEFAAWYAAYPLHVARGAAWKAYRAARRKTKPAVLLAGARGYAVACEGKERQFIAHPSTWLNAERWLDGGGYQEDPTMAHPVLDVRPDYRKHPLWSRCERSIDSTDFRSWIAICGVVSEGDAVVTLKAPSKFAQDWVETRYRHRLEAALKKQVEWA